MPKGIWECQFLKLWKKKSISALSKLENMEFEGRMEQNRILRSDLIMMDAAQIIRRYTNLP